MRIICLITLTLLFMNCPDSGAQDKIDLSERKAEKRFYVGNGMDFAMISTAMLSKPGSASKLTSLRFTALVNLGFTFNYDLGRRFGLFSGLGIRNMGFIEKDGDSTVKRRVYSLGIPLGIKIGDLRNRNFFFAGGGIDIPFNYREKGFVKRGNKEKFNEWFSDRTPRVMPFLFAGYSFDPGIMLKMQYYPGNFMNEDYEESEARFGNLGSKPYQGYDVHLLLLSLGVDIHYGQHKKQEREYREMKKKAADKKLL